MSRMFTYLVRLMAVLLVLPLHEYAHAWVASKLGDPTARYQGRLDFNPLKHVDPIGAISLVLFGFGWAKPVPINPGYFNNPKKGMAIVAAAGPVSNLLMGLMSMAIYKLFMIFYFATDFHLLYIVAFVFSTLTSINISLAVFNLLPIPPLDGSRIAALFLPSDKYFKIMQYEHYIMLGLMLVLMTGILDPLLGVLSNGCYWVLDLLTKFIDPLMRLFV